MTENIKSIGNMNDATSDVSALLTICIPTHNRRAALEECLASVLPQADALGVGVCVSDNSSSDGTWQLLEALKKQYPWMQTMRHTRDIGYRDNLTGVVLFSHTHYVWPLGDKLVLLPGTLEFVVAELVRLHPDAVVVNIPDQVVSTVERIYSAPQSCLTDLGWYVPLCGATVLPRQAWVGMLHVQSPSRDFPQVVAFFSYLASLRAPRVLFPGRVLIGRGKSAIENHVDSSGGDRRLETWGRNWYDVVMSLPALYSTNDKLQAVRSVAEHTQILGLLWLIYLRWQGQLTLERLNVDEVPLRAAVSVPWWSVVIISVVPRSVLRLVHCIHPWQLLQAMQRRLRLLHGQQAHRSAQ